MIHEIIVDTILGGGIAAPILVIKRHLRKPPKKANKDSFGSYPWLWESGTKYCGYRCPKCREIKGNKAQPECCSCDEFHKEHFHFKCADCKFKCIMRTADDE